MTWGAINFCLYQAQTEEGLFFFFLNVDAAPKAVACISAVVSQNLLRFLQFRASYVLYFHNQEHTYALELNDLFRVNLPSDFQ